jgi:hypothetical protein
MDNDAALLVLLDGVHQWYLEINDTINGDLRSNPTQLAATGEELTRQAWAIRNADPVPA